MGLKEIFQAIREYPAACAELRQTRLALEQSEQKCGALEDELGEQSHHLKFLSQRSAALQAALEEFCPRVSTLHIPSLLHIFLCGYPFSSAGEKAGKRDKEGSKIEP